MAIDVAGHGLRSTTVAGAASWCCGAARVGSLRSVARHSAARLRVRQLARSQGWLRRRAASKLGLRVTCDR